MSDDSQNETSQDFFSGRVPLILLSVLVVISLIAVCGLGYSLIRSSQDASDSDGSGEPTPFPQVAGSGSFAGDPIVYGISDSSTVSVTLDLPVNLGISGRQFAVQQVSINPDGSWSPQLPDSNTAGWVYGSIINYIMALTDSDDNRTLIESLVPGAQMIITTQSGANFVFEYESSRQVEVNDQSIFRQLQPGMTLILTESGEDQRLVANGRFLQTESAGTEDSGRASIGVGETAQLSDVQVTVTNVTFYPNDPNAPSGFSFFVVDFQLFNPGPTPLDVSQLQLTLVDEVGNQYALNPVASRLGQNEPLTGGFLNAGATLPASVGYQVPDGLVSSSVTVTIFRRDTGDQVQVNIPYSGSNAAQSTTITLQSVTVSNDLTSMTMVGQVNNLGEQTLIVKQEDVTLRTPDGASYLLLATNPPFPWTVPAGQTLQYAVTFQTPINADTAIFNILNQPFQLTNLQ
ncbi:MAG: DUF4352 domain-containing protein [Candidatus Promineifilaceae bacterium]|nr:DUF4352 domain-containing protein [Candidatus Promineifilaceae bacterium]